MAQSLQIDIKTTSDVPQAMDKAKAATVGFGKQVEDIKKKFGTSFKDIFLSFLGPMALVAAAMQFITKLIADDRQKRDEANQAAIDGTNKLMSAEDRYYANKRNNIEKDRKAVAQALLTREEVTLDFLKNDERGKLMVKQNPFNAFDPRESFMPRSSVLADDKDIQAKVQAFINADMQKGMDNPGSALPNSTPFKAPEGFSNVVGVGANPVMEAMNAQLEEAQKQTALLERIASPEGGVPKDFTKDSK